MNPVLVRKLLRDMRVGLPVICLLLFAFFCLWCKVTQQTVELMNKISKGADIRVLKHIFFNTDTGKLAQSIMGGEDIDPTVPLHNLSIGFMHPLVQTILCIWAIGRASGAIAGEIDKGTMELLLAQPIQRYCVVLSHLALDVLTIPLLCLGIWAGISLGSTSFSIADWSGADPNKIDPRRFGPPLLNVAALLFAIGGYTMWLSASGRFRMRVLGIAVLVTLLMFMANLIGQMWRLVQFVRPFTVFFYYQPQPVILDTTPPRHLVLGDISNTQLLLFNIAVLTAVGLVGYALALWTFCRRDLPAPL